MHYCAYHNTEHDESEFRIRKNGKLDSWCIEGRREHGRKYSKKAYAPVKEEVKAKQEERESRKSQTCTACKEEKPIGQFPFRYDRPTKRESRCEVCLGRLKKQRNAEYHIINRDSVRENKRQYRAKNPARIRDHSRKRRARKKEVRHDPYTEQEIFERDKGLCYFCGNPVDPALKYPHLQSLVIHHLHPIVKKGPDTPDNVALAHNQCNGRQRDKYDSPFREGWSVKPISKPLAREIAKEFHYLHRGQNVSFAFGLFPPDSDSLVGMVSFGSPSSYRINRSACPSEPNLVIELNRLWISDSAPFGAASWFVSRALKQLPPRIVVSYADTSISDERNDRPHDGSVYKALSFFYAGCSRPRKEWRLPGKSRNTGKIPGAVLTEVPAKHRYWTLTGTRRDKKALWDICEWPN